MPHVQENWADALQLLLFNLRSVPVALGRTSEIGIDKKEEKMKVWVGLSWMLHPLVRIVGSFLQFCDSDRVARAVPKHVIGYGLYRVTAITHPLH
jgi:hypothetical protein